MKRENQNYAEYLRAIEALGPNSSHDPSRVWHNPESEALPDFPIYKSLCVDAVLAFNSLHRSLRLKVETGALKDPSLAEGLLKELGVCSSPAYGKPEIIGFYGRTGQGKSAAVGSLLGDNTLTKQVLEHQLIGFSANDLVGFKWRKYHTRANSISA